jgi:hypothetical protein
MSEEEDHQAYSPLGEDGDDSSDTTTRQTATYSPSDPDAHGHFRVTRPVEVVQHKCHFRFHDTATVFFGAGIVFTALSWTYMEVDPYMTNYACMNTPFVWVQRLWHPTSDGMGDPVMMQFAFLYCSVFIIPFCVCTYYYLANTAVLFYYYTDIDQKGFRRLHTLRLLAIALLTVGLFSSALVKTYECSSFVMGGYVVVYFLSMVISMSEIPTVHRATEQRQMIMFAYFANFITFLVVCMVIGPRAIDPSPQEVYTADLMGFGIRQTIKGKE